MRTLTRSILAAGTVAGLLALPVAGAGAASNTTVQFTVAEGTTLSVANADGNDNQTITLSAAGGLNFGADAAQTLTGDLPETTVTDERGGFMTGWEVTVASGDWVRDTSDDADDGVDRSHSISRSNARVALPVDGAVATATDGVLGGMTISTFESQELGLDGAANNLGSNGGTGYILIAGTTSVGSGQVSYTPGIELSVPANTPSGTYSATVTQTIE